MSSKVEAIARTLYIVVSASGYCPKFGYIPTYAYSRYLWVRSLPMGMVPTYGYGPYLWVWSLPMGIVPTYGYGPYLWVWSLPMGMISPSGYGPYVWVFNALNILYLSSLIR